MAQRTTVQLADSLHWLRTCHEEADHHTHVSQYLVDTADGHVLVDAGTGHPDELVAAVNQLTDGRGPEALLLTHCILPHTRNVGPIRDEFGDVEVFCPIGVPQLVGLSEARPQVTNETEAIAGGQFTFMDPLLTDVVVSSWIYHHETGTLFTAEGVGHYHRPGDCDRTSTEFSDGIPRELISTFADDKLKFLEYVDGSKLRIAFDTLLQEYEIERIAPMHGNPVVGSDVEPYLDRLVRSVETFGEDVGVA